MYSSISFSRLWYFSNECENQAIGTIGTVVQCEKNLKETVSFFVTTKKWTFPFACVFQYCIFSAGRVFDRREARDTKTAESKEKGGHTEMSVPERGPRKKDCLQREQLRPKENAFLKSGRLIKLNVSVRGTKASKMVWVLWNLLFSFGLITSCFFGQGCLVAVGAKIAFLREFAFSPCLPFAQ